MSDTQEKKDIAVRDPQEVAFEAIQRRARLYTASELVPKIYQGNTPQALANTVIALNLARRIGADELMVMQNLNVIQGKPSWSSTFVISALNACGRFTPIRFEMRELGPITLEGKQAKDMECRAVTNDANSGEALIGPPVTLSMAVAEGWYGKNGSKWRTMPELMIRYRAAAFFGRLYAPDILNGMHTTDEIEDFRDVTPRPEDIIKPAANAAPVAPEPAEDVSELWTALLDYGNADGLPAQAKKEIEAAIARKEEDPAELTKLLAKVKTAYEGANRG